MEINQNLSEKAQHDFRLVELAKEGDQKAYAELMKRYKDAIYYMLLKMINNKTDAEDLTMEAFSKAFKSLQQYSPSYAFSTWLFKIASNNCIDFLRKKRTNTISLDVNFGNEDKDTYLPQFNVKDDEPDPEEYLIRLQKSALMRNVVKNLRPRYRKLIEMRYFNEFSYEEISAELNLPLGTVKAQLFRARELLSGTLRSSDFHND